MGHRRLAALFSTTLFISAYLLFWVEPMLAKMALPPLGGTPAVWNTCMLFFQAMLLAGYAYAHWIGKRLSSRGQIVVQIAFFALAIASLPIGLWEPALRWLPAEANPAPWLLGCLLVSAGLPFFALSANGPLLQLWFSRSSHAAAGDPYFLYASSNLGSLFALLSYPLLLEPALRLNGQSRCWSATFLILGALVLGSGLLALGTGCCHAQARDVVESPSMADPTPRVRTRQRFRWCILAFVPSSLMLGVTTYLTTDIASIPLLWVLPLSIYLLTFVFAFSRRGDIRWRWTERALPIGALGLAYVLLSEATQPVAVLIGLHLLVFFLAAMTCHGRLAWSRPSAERVTEFYLWVAIGGVLGGLFNALAAPVLFSRVAEYPLALVLACALIPARPTGFRQLASSASGRATWLDLGVAIALGLLVILLANLVPRWAYLPLQLRLGIVFGLPLMICYAAVDKPSRFALSLSGVLAASALFPGIHGQPLHIERNFFGVLRVTHDPLGPFIRLVHGNTIHGRQATDPARRCEPLSYYHRTGPLGQIIDLFRARHVSPEVGVIGLGAGTMASYARPNENWTFYEINPAVARIARNTNYFTFLNACAAGPVRIVLGDARLRLRDAPPHQYGLMVLDAFSSDAIPLHLVTREALQLYLSKLAPGGVLAFHISNRSLQLEGVLGDLASDANLVCHAHDEVDPRVLEISEGKDQSHWLVMARRPEDLGRMLKDSRWLPIAGRAHARVWTDDYSNILSVFKWD